MDNKKIFFILIFFLGVSSQYGWILEKSGVERSRIGIFSSIQDDLVLHLGIYYTYQISETTELGWGINFHEYSNEEQYLLGSTVTLGPMWGHTIKLGKSGFGLRFSLNLWISLYSSLTTTEGQNDSTKFTAETDPQLLLFKTIKLGKNVCLFPAFGAAVYLTYMERTEVEEMDKGLVETRLIITLPIKINTGKKSFMMIEPISRISLYSNRYKKVENYGIRFSYLF